MEIDSSHVNLEGDVPQCEFMLAIEPDVDGGATMDVSFIYVHLLQSIVKDDVGGRVIVNEYLLVLQLAMSSEMTMTSC